ncbi:Rha family transcriptional regulator [Providencia sp. PROV255]|uniref:Rha family transcriptional regulator n=1 Tax=Providencia sp. PROV255 TaxID=2949943 RepID=UPI00300DF8F0
MSSREIAKLTGKRHDHVCRDIRTILVALLGGKDADYIRNPDLGYKTNQHVTCLQYESNSPNSWELQCLRRIYVHQKHNEEEFHAQPRCPHRQTLLARH